MCMFPSFFFTTMDYINTVHIKHLTLKKNLCSDKGSANKKIGHCRYIDLFIPVAIPESNRLFNHTQRPESPAGW